MRRATMVVLLFGAGCNCHPDAVDEPDSGEAQPDAGMELDAGLETDAGVFGDAGESADAGETADAGGSVDGGAPRDAGIWTCSATDWCTQPVVSDGSRLTSIWGAGANDIWTVGNGGVALHWEGVSWTPVASGTGNDLTQVWGLASNDVWAVGAAGTTVHWNGSAWAPVASGSTQYLRGLWGCAANDVWAVGGSANILHWDGSVWSTVTGVPPSPNVEYISVWGSGPQDVWFGAFSQLLHKVGNQWSMVSVDLTSHGAGIFMNSLSGLSASDIWAVGHVAPGGQHAVHWDGTKWRREPSGTQNLGQTATFFGVWAIAANDVWAVGEEDQYGSPTPVIVSHWNGAQWARVPVPVSLWLWDVWASGPNDVWAVGEQGMILHHRP